MRERNYSLALLSLWDKNGVVVGPALWAKPWPPRRTLTNVMLLEKFVQPWQILHNEMAQDPLVGLHSYQSGAEVGGRHQIFNDGTHHPKGIFLLQEQKQGSHYLAGGKGRPKGRCIIHIYTHIRTEVSFTFWEVQFSAIYLKKLCPPCSFKVASLYSKLPSIFSDRTGLGQLEALK